MPDKLTIELKLISTYFDDGTIPKPILPYELDGGTFRFEFENKKQLIEYTGKLYAQYTKFENPQTGLVADLLAQIAKQITK